MTRHGSLVTIAALGVVFWLTLVFIGEVSDFDWRECLNRSDGSAAKGPRFGEPGTVELLRRAAFETPAAALNTLRVWFFPMTTSLMTLPAMVSVWISRSDRRRRLEVLWFAALCVLLLAFVLPPSDNHDCDRKGTDFGVLLLPVFGLVPAAVIALIPKE